jgi:hypothetical protein
VFEQVGITCGQPYPGIGWTLPGDRAVVAVDTKIVADLQIKRGIAKHFAGFDAFGTANAEVFLDVVFPVWIFNELAFDCAGRAKLVFGRRSQLRGVRLKIAKTKPAIAADWIRLNTLHCRGRQDAICGAVSTLRAFHGIDLPDSIFLSRPKDCQSADQTQAKGSYTAEALADELETRYGISF